MLRMSAYWVKVNLMNLFASYTGEPRLFEVEAVMEWVGYIIM